MGSKDFSTWEEEPLIATIKDIVTTNVSPIVHVQLFEKMAQKDEEKISVYLQRLRSRASSCDFSCPHCKESTVEPIIKNKFVLGLKDKTMQKAALKSLSVKPDTTLEQILNEMLILEQNSRDQETVAPPKEHLICSMDDNHVFSIKKKQQANKRSVVTVTINSNQGIYALQKISDATVVESWDISAKFAETKVSQHSDKQNLTQETSIILRLKRGAETQTWMRTRQSDT